MRNTLFAIAVLALALPLAAQDSPALSPGEIVAQAKAEEWVAIPAEELLVMTLAPDAEGNARQVVIQLMPPPFSQGWIDNIRLFARSGWYDGISVNRVQDNYVVQWGDPNYDNPEATGETKPLPEGLKVVGEDEYRFDETALSEADMMLSTPDDLRREMGAAAFLWVADSALNAVLSNPDVSEAEKETAIQEYLKMTENVPVASPLGTDNEMSAHEIAMISIKSTATTVAPEGWHQRDSYAEWVEFWRGWPLANENVSTWRNADDKEIPFPNLPQHEARKLSYWEDVQESWFWPVHCYGMVGVGRNLSPDTGSGAELYTVIGHAPRHLDRNIALVGRVIEGMEHLSSLPRGKGALGFYAPDEVHKRTPILTVRVASDLPEASPASSSEAVGQQIRPKFEYLSTDGETFARYAEARANRRDPFFNVSAGGADICNIPVPIRRMAE